MSLLMDALRKAEKAQQTVKNAEKPPAPSEPEVMAMAPLAADEAFETAVVHHLDSSTPEFELGLKNDETPDFAVPNLDLPPPPDKTLPDDSLEWESDLHPNLTHLHPQQEWTDPREEPTRLDWHEELSLQESPANDDDDYTATGEHPIPTPSAPDTPTLNLLDAEPDATPAPPIPAKDVPPSPEPAPPAVADQQKFAHQLQSASRKQKSAASWFMPALLVVVVLVVVGGGGYFYLEFMAMQSGGIGVPTGATLTPPPAGMLDLKARAQQKREAAPDASAPATAPPSAAEASPNPPPASPVELPTAVVAEPVAPPVVSEPIATPQPRAPTPTAPVVAKPAPVVADPVIEAAAQDLLVLDGPLQIKRRIAPQPINQLVRNAFNTYQSGDFATAEKRYRRALSQAPRSRQIMLGLAACLLQQGKTQAAKHTYQELLRLYPDDAVAESALLNLDVDSSDLSSESHLKSRLAEQPDNAYLHFALGNVLSKQKRWADAQQAYFDAYRYDKTNPNYTYNLAISLEHLGKSDTALSFYEQAYTLSAQAPAQFDRQRLAQRISALQHR